jgi:hypothetical protein
VSTCSRKNASPEVVSSSSIEPIEAVEDTVHSTALLGGFRMNMFLSNIEGHGLTYGLKKKTQTGSEKKGINMRLKQTGGIALR